MKIIELFEIEFIDNTKLWATINEENNVSKIDWKNTTERSECGDFFNHRRLDLEHVVFGI